MSDPVERVRACLDGLEGASTREREEALSLLKGWVDMNRGSKAPEASDLPGKFGMVGGSPAMEKVFNLLARLVRTDVPVLILGESGTGKELVAKALHQQGARRKGPFLPVNCAAIPATLLESEIFGHKKGSFTGAHRDRKGYAQAADGGTLFLDEIGEMPLELQSKLLRFLEGGEVRPVGSNEILHVNVRVVAATNQVLSERIAAKQFREDLFYRLAVLTLEMPPLRERLEDVPSLAAHFLAANADEGLPGAVLSEDALDALSSFSWPGNIRQLQNELTRASAFCKEGVIRAVDLSPELREG